MNTAMPEAPGSAAGHLDPVGRRVLELAAAQPADFATLRRGINDDRLSRTNTRQAIHNTVLALQERGWITIRSDGNGNGKIVHLTPAGREVLAKHQASRS